MKAIDNKKIEKTISIYKKEIFLILISIGLLLFSLVNLVIINHKKNYVPKVYYRTYTKEKGWSKWSSNGKTSGNEHDITAIQIKLKDDKDGKLVYSCLYKNEWDSKKTYNSNEVCGNKKDKIRSIRIKLIDLKDKYYKATYRVNVGEDKWTTWFENFIPSYTWDKNNKTLPVKRVQIKIAK